MIDEEREVLATNSKILVRETEDVRKGNEQKKNKFKEAIEQGKYER